MSDSSEKPTAPQRALRVPIVPAPKLPYEPRELERYRPGIAIVGCGGITKWHLRAYKEANYKVVAFCDMVLARAQERRDEFYPDAIATDSFEQILTNDDVVIVDITTHPPERPPLVE